MSILNEEQILSELKPQRRVPFRNLRPQFSNSRNARRNRARRRNRNRSSQNRPSFRTFRRPRLSVTYGQQQDLAFGNGPKRGVSNVFTTPVSESKIVQSYFKFSDDCITLCQPVNSACYILNEAIIPLHPMLMFGRTANLALNFSTYSIESAIIHYVPLIGSTSTGMIAMASTQNCTPVTYDTVTAFNALTQINAEINPVWMCSKHVVRDIDRSVKNMAPMNRKDIANVVFVIGTGLAGSLAASCMLFLEISIKFSRPNPSPSLNPFTAVVQIITAAAGVRCNTVTTSNLHGVVINSTATNVDIGEYIQCPAFPVVATDYDISFTHNNSAIDYASAPDQGTIYVLYFTEN